jgi:hypothetical protein
MNIKLKYKIGKKIITDNKIMTVIGFEYIEERGLRYILLNNIGSEMKWEYLYGFEIEALKCE